MFITFSTKAHENISFFEGVALRLLTLMGHSGSVPGAIEAKDVPQALGNLQRGINAEDSTKEASQDEEEQEPEISLAKRALPLITLLKAAEKNNNAVLWESSKFI